jgi:arylsulfatase A-like enzyme
MVQTLARCVSKAIFGSIVCAGLVSCSPPVPMASASNIVQEAGSRPNILLIVADDLGYSDIGALGSEIETPNIDALIRDGLALTNFYAGGACSPTRAMLMSGMDHHRAGVGNMMEHIAPNQKGQPGYEGYLNSKVVALPELLRDAGYQTYGVGKWHLGRTADTSPAARGFQKSFMLLDGGAGHFDQSGLNARSNPAPYRENGVSVSLPPDFDYSTDFFTRRMKTYIEQGKNNGRPFFGYLAYTAPHWPLQAPAETIRKYQGRYDKGWEAIQQERLAKMIKLGLIPASTSISAIHPKGPTWSGLKPEQRRTEARKMEIYAAMVDRLDQQIGEMIDYLKKSGQYENTVIVFMSDNGPEGAPLSDLPMFKSWMDSFDNSYANMGAKGSYVFYETRWAQVSATPFRLYKGMSSEGGVHVPAFVTFGPMKARGRNSSVTSVMDIAPTLLDLAGVQQPGDRYANREILPMQGRSWVPVMTRKAHAVRSSNEGIGFELFNKMGYRQGKWKAINLEQPFGSGSWELYNLKADPGETRNLAAKYPDRIAQMARAWDAHALQNGVVLGSTPPER